MTDHARAIEAGATNATNRIAKIVSMSPETRDNVHGIIQEALAGFVNAAIASGALVPLSKSLMAGALAAKKMANEKDKECSEKIVVAVAEMRERCAKMCDDLATELTLEQQIEPHGTAYLCRAAEARKIAAAIRQLDTAPASGDKPRPSDCAQPMQCGWHRARTEPDINLWLCDVPGCKHMLHAASRTGGGK
jgi:hypothetical protein